MTSMSERLANLTPEKLALLKKAMGSSQGISEPIAVVGMGCRFAGVANVDEYWHVITESIDKTGEIPKSRWDLDEFFDAKGGTPGKMTTRWGGFLNDIDQFDATFFGISPREAEKMDPQHRLLLEVVWEALEYGGIAPSRLRESATGVFVGIGGVDYSRIPVQLDNYYEQITAYSGTGNALSIAANRISYTLDLRGPSLSIDTACSSSLVAAHLAIRSLRSRECDMAIVGGVNAILTPETTLAFSQAQMLSPDGKCRPFDHRANGYVRGEGCGALILKRLSDATSDQDNILAVIRGSAINQDGLTSGITAPRGTAQVAVIQRALKDAGVKSTDISYVEAHGTATPLGDPIEVNALSEIFRQSKNTGADVKASPSPCYIGSVKANIGHTETAAGMASLIKTILMLRNQSIPRQLHYESLNPHIRLSDSRLKVADSGMQWDTGGKPRIAGVSSFGFGGTNSHVVLEEFAAKAETKSSNDRPAKILVLSAKNPERLQELARNYQRTFDKLPDSNTVGDICFTAASGRTHFNHRLAIVAEDATQFSSRLDDYLDGVASKSIVHGKTKGERRLKIAFLFPGQGSQFPKMGQQLYNANSVYRAAIDRCDAALSELLPQRLLDVLFEQANSNGQPSSTGKQHYKIHDTLYTQPALFAVEYALSQLWRSFGIVPAVVAGHSVGDYVAACDAGVFSVEDGLRLIAHRARLVSSLPRTGMMAAVMAPRHQVSEWIKPYLQDVNVAVHNGPKNTVISGRSEVVTELLAQFESNGVQSKVLEVSHAMHSPLLDPILDEFEQVAGEIKFSKPSSAWISSLDGREADQRVCSAKYWREHLRNTVCYVDSAQTLHSFGLDAAIEMGPGSTLCSLSSRIWNDSSTLLLPSMRAAQSEWDVLLQSLAQLYVQGENVDWKGFDKPYSRKRLVLPTYPFQRQSHWYDMSRKVVGAPRINSSSRSIHPLLGNQLQMAGDKVVFEVVLSTNQPSFLVDHRVDQNAVFPAAGYVEQGLAAAGYLFGPGSHTVTDLFIQQAMVFAENQARVAQIQVGPDQRGERSFDVFSRSVNSNADDKTVWTHHATGVLRQQAEAATSHHKYPTLDIDAKKASLPNNIESADFYKRMADVGLKYGPFFNVLDSVSGGEGECLAHLVLPETITSQLAAYKFHPSILDGCLQSMAGAIVGAGKDDVNDLLLPTLVQDTVVVGKIAGPSLWVHTKLHANSDSADSYTADLNLFDESGTCVAVVSGARVQRIARQRATKGADQGDLTYATNWVKTAPSAGESAGGGRNGKATTSQWLVFDDQTGFADTLISELIKRGEQIYVARDGDSFAKLNNDNADHIRAIYQISPTQLADYEHLFSSIAGSDATSVNVIDCRAIGSASAIHTDEHLDRMAISGAGRTLMTFRAFAKAKTIKPSRFWLLTKRAQQVLDEDRVDPSQSALWGMARCAMVEMPQLSLRLIDVDWDVERDARAAEAVNELIGQAAGHGDNGDTEDHVAVRGVDRYVGRLQAIDQVADKAKPAKELVVPSGRFHLRANTAQGIDGLYYSSFTSRELGPHDVEIQVGAAGLNFSDVLKAMGLYPGVKDEIVPLGIECAGVVTKIGDSVTDFEIGQRVMGVAPYSFASHATTADYAIVATPDNLSDQQASTIPITFLTAYHGLVRLAQLAAGERLLIHAGAGGVGLAAIQIAQEIGAEIFATAGSDQKREFLKSLGVEHVFDSRTLKFADQILEVTSGRGVDVVLNSLPGEAITKSLSILSAYGRFLEIGKTDIYQNRKVGLWPFQDNLSYFAIDLDRMLRQRPADIKRLYAEVMPKFAAGTYQPLPFKTFETEKVVDAYRYMSQRRNIGKVVVSIAQPSSSNSAKGASNVGVKSDTSQIGDDNENGSVLITGGLGALGQQVAKWAIDRGTKHIVMLTRQSPEAVQDKADSLRTAGIEIAVVQGDVANYDSLQQAISAIPKTFPPIRGIVHAAGVLKDGLMQTMELEQLEVAMAPKVEGAWNLARLFKQQLDYFVMFSSVAGAIGSPGQGNYAAGNAFLDGLASRLRSEGVPAVSIAWGPWGAAGMAANEDIRKQLAERGMRPLDPDVAINLMDIAVKNQHANVTITDADWGTLIAKLPGDGTTLLKEFRDRVSNATAAPRRPRDERLFKQLDAADANGRQAILQQVIATTIGDVMGVDASTIDAEQPLASLGLDSLMGMELRTNLEAKLGFEMPMSALMDDPSVVSLALVANQILSEASGAEAIVVTAENETPENAAAIAKPRKASDLSRRSDLVTLGGIASSLEPLFCIHPVGGDLRCYDNFARAMQHRLVYGLRAHGLQAGTTPHTTLDQMIDDYIAAIRAQQPDGPYCLMGWSTGGIFAYEIVKRLLDLGLEVKPLIMVDTPLPSVFEKVDLNDNAKFLVDLIEFANYFAGTSMQVSYDQLRGQSENASLTSVLDLAIQHNVLPAQTNQGHLKRLIDVCRWHVEFLQAYKPPVLQHRADLIRPEDTSILSEAARQEHSDDFGWGKLLEVKLHRVSGHHFTMMTGNNAAGIAATIESLLTGIEQPIASSTDSKANTKQESASGIQ